MKKQLTRSLKLQIFVNGKNKITTMYKVLNNPKDLKQWLNGVIASQGYKTVDNAILKNYDYVRLTTLIRFALEATEVDVETKGRIFDEDHYEGDRLIINITTYGKESHITFGTVDGELVPGHSSEKEEPIVIILRNF